MVVALLHGRYQDIAHTILQILIFIFVNGAATEELGPYALAHDSETFTELAWRRMGEQNDPLGNDYEFNTLHTTAHSAIYSLSFQPGSGASGYDLPDAPPTVTTSTPHSPQSLRGALPTRLSALPTTT